MSEFDRRQDAASARTDDESISKIAAKLAGQISEGQFTPPALLSFSKQKQDQPLPVLFGTRDFVEPPIAFIGDGGFFVHKADAKARPIWALQGLFRGDTNPTSTIVQGDLVRTGITNIGTPVGNERFVHYYYTALFILCHGVIDYVPTIRLDDRLFFINPFIDQNQYDPVVNDFPTSSYQGHFILSAGMGKSQVFYTLSNRLFKAPHPNTLDGVGGSVRITSGLDREFSNHYLESFLREAYSSGTFTGITLPPTRQSFVPKFEGVSTVLFPKFWWGTGTSMKKVTVRAQRIYSREIGRETDFGWYPEKAGIEITSDFTEKVVTYSTAYRDIHRLEQPTLFIQMGDLYPMGFYTPAYVRLNNPSAPLPGPQPFNFDTTNMISMITAFWRGLIAQFSQYIFQNNRFRESPSASGAPAQVMTLQYSTFPYFSGLGLSHLSAGSGSLARTETYQREASNLPMILKPIADDIDKACEKFAKSAEVIQFWGRNLPTVLRNRIRCVIYWLPSSRFTGNLSFNVGYGTGGRTFVDHSSSLANNLELVDLLAKWRIDPRLVCLPSPINYSAPGQNLPVVHGVFRDSIDANNNLIRGQVRSGISTSGYSALGSGMGDYDPVTLYQDKDIFICDKKTQRLSAPRLPLAMNTLGRFVATNTRAYYNQTNKVPSNRMFTVGSTPSIPNVIHKADIRYYNMNPAHAIRDVKTSLRYGQGVPTFEIDDFSFRAAADTYYREGMGISIIWDKQSTPDEFIKLINKHTNSVTYVDHTTGKYKLYPIRDDVIVADTPILSPDNVVMVEDYRQPTFDDLVTSLRVSYWEIGSRQTLSFTVHDETALRAQNNRFKLSKVKYAAFVDQTTVVKAAYRDLRALSRPLISCTLKVFYFAAADFHLGKMFRLTWPDYGLLTLPMRVTSINFGDAKVNFITITAVQDGYEPQPPDSFIIDSEDLSGEADITYSVTPPTIDYGPTVPTDAPEPVPDPSDPTYPPPAFPRPPQPFSWPDQDRDNLGELIPSPPFYYSVEELSLIHI